MTEITCTYTGDGETALVHGPTGTTLKTDLPPDNGGKGRCFSPTDLLAAAFASCTLTIMGKMAAARGDDLQARIYPYKKLWPPTRAAWANLCWKLLSPRTLRKNRKSFICPP